MKLPPLPETDYLLLVPFCLCEGTYDSGARGYSEAQMEAYGKQCRNSTLEEVSVLCTTIGFDEALTNAGLVITKKCTRKIRDLIC